MIDVDKINSLKQNDVYSLILYAIYKATDDPNYSTISQLIYSLDRKSLVNLCNIFGGCTIKIPTIQQLQEYTDAFLVWSLVNEKKYSFEVAFKKAGIQPGSKKNVFYLYKVIDEIMNDVQHTN